MSGVSGGECDAALAGPDAATSVVAAQAEVGVKTNEVPMAAVVLGQIDLNDKVVTADALHTVKATADHIHDHGGTAISTPTLIAASAEPDLARYRDRSRLPCRTAVEKILHVPGDRREALPG